MAAPTSLAFRALDHHVVRGLADEPALRDAAGQLTYAELLHESAVIAGALRLLGLADADELHLDLEGRDRVVAVLAALRLQVVPGAADGVRVVGRPAVATIGGESVPWEALRALGRTDPLPAPAEDLADVVAWHRQHADVVDPLLAGRTIDL